MSTPRLLIASFVCFLVSGIVQAQEHGTAEHTTKEHAAEEHHHPAMKGANRLTLGLGHAHLSQGKIEGQTQWAPAASWSLNYDYWLTNKLAIGLQNDWILETLVIEHGDNKELERENPLAVVPVVMYKFAPRLSGVVGAGAEFASGETIGLTRIGLEYGWHLPKDWEAGLWDNRWSYYNAWVFSFTFSKIWPKKHAETVHH